MLFSLSFLTPAQLDQVREPALLLLQLAADDTSNAWLRTTVSLLSTLFDTFSLNPEVETEFPDLNSHIETIVANIGPTASRQLPLHAKVRSSEAPDLAEHQHFRTSHKPAVLELYNSQQAANHKRHTSAGNRGAASRRVPTISSRAVGLSAWADFPSCLTVI